jgi:aminopeptidase N
VFVPDALQSSHPVSMITNDPDVILSNFDSISYDKGASIIRMMANFIGSDTFDKGIVAYLNKYKFGNAAKLCVGQGSL